MSGDAWMYAGLLALALVLPVAALRGGGMSGSAAAKMAAVWLAIFVAAALAFSSLGG